MRLRARSGVSDALPPTAMSPVSNPTSFDHSYELPLRRNLLLLLDLLGLLRFVAGVLLDRHGVASWQGEVHLPGQPWGGEHANDATLERFLEARLWETGTRSLTAPRYRRWRVAQPADDKLAAEGDAEDAAAVCAICLAGLEPGDFETVVVELCSCSHAFHAACIDAWVRSGDDAATCPLCRAPMLPTPWDDRTTGRVMSRARPGD